MKNKKDKIVNLIKGLLSRKKLVIILAILIVGFLGWRLLVGRKKEDAETTEVKRGVVAEELILSGEVKADEHAELTFSASGKISWVGVSEGDQVEKGQTLARLDTTGLSMDLKIADADLRAKASTLDRVYDDLKDKEDSESFPEIETRTTAETNKDKAVFTHIKEQKDLANATLVSPFKGVVSYIANPFSGLNVLYSQTQIEIVNPETVYFEVSADQTEVIDLSVGQKAKIILDSFIEQELEGEIKFISYTPMSGEVGAVYKVKVNFPVEVIDVRKLRIGMTGDAKFVLSEKSDVLYVPPQFLNSDTKGRFLRLNRNNNKVYVDIGLEGEERVEVIGEINEGDTVYD